MKRTCCIKLKRHACNIQGAVEENRGKAWAIGSRSMSQGETGPDLAVQEKRHFLISGWDLRIFSVAEGDCWRVKEQDRLPC